MDDTKSKGLVKFDSLSLRHGGMYATNGHALYRSRNVIMDCIAKLLDCDKVSRALITVADIGTADGSTSLSLLNDIISEIRKYPGESRQILICYTDQPGNDFNRLFNVIHGETGLRRDPKVFYSVIGRTMYEQCLPDSSADLIFSSIAAMALSKSHCCFVNGVSPLYASEDELVPYKAKVTLDWKTFLLKRAKELRPGGYLVVLNIGTTKQGEIPIHIEGGMATLGHILKTLVVDGLITKDEFMECNIGYEMFRTEDDHALPFKENDNELLEIGLELVSTRSFVHKMSHASFAITKKDDVTKKAYADRIIAGIKPWFHDSIYKGMSCTRSQQERECLVNTYFQRLWEFAYSHNNQIPQMALVEIVARKRYE
ncbi:uncharacterized protein LOC132560180 [Ylistrum balloti]|uniref:uncharacterized protein LOC132560180 n=1 Tax=Ylistrum balloti TaxID=509963 RepID=UPI002905B73A|nr:uncharacterized protein LOC132560180 [Ylistrum balloti]